MLWSGLQLMFAASVDKNLRSLFFLQNPLFPNLGAFLVPFWDRRCPSPSPLMVLPVCPMEHGALWSTALSSAPGCPRGCLALCIFPKFPIRF